MVEGMNLFRDKFKGFEDCYTVIGGAACDILMNEADIDFRAAWAYDFARRGGRTVAAYILVI